MFAVIRTGGKQYKVSKNDRITVERLDAREGDKVKIDDVLMVSDGKSCKTGTPGVSGASVTAKVVACSRLPKVCVFKKKRRQNYRRTKGHKQHVTVLEITDIKVA